MSCEYTLSETLAETNYLLPRNEEIEPMNEHWYYLKNGLLSLIDYRLDSSSDRWYQEQYMYEKFYIDEFYPSYPSDINRLPKGIVAEGLFLEACKLTNKECSPCLGREDVIGADFRITYGRETRFFDVTVNTSERGFRKKVREGRFPSLFLPWKENENNNGYKRSYAERYLRTGTINTEEYFSNIISSNYKILDKLKRSFWRGEKSDERILGKGNFDYSRAGIQYIKNLEGVLKVLRKCNY